MDIFLYFYRMEVNELRIGNLVEFKSMELYSEIKGIFLHSCTQNDWRLETKSHGLNALSNYKGIPLTEEWLIRAGFVVDGTMYFKLVIDEYSNLFFDLKHKTIAIGVEYECGGTDIEFKYVHQLQNLYFALTGKELTIHV